MRSIGCKIPHLWVGQYLSNHCFLASGGPLPRELTFPNLTQAGYAVIFLNRRHSIQPFTKGLPSGEIMDTLTDVLDCNGGSTLKVKDDASNIVRQAVAKAKQVQKFQRQRLSA